MNAKDKAYIKEKGWDKIEQGTRETIAKRLAPAFIPNDGKQTPIPLDPYTIPRYL